ncbi:MAG: endopeptidase La [Fusobacteriota bacterium]
MENIQTDKPVLLIKNIIIFPYMIVPLSVGRDFSIEAIKKALDDDKEIMIFTQKKRDTDEVAMENVYEIGVAAKILKMARDSKGFMKILIKSYRRVKLEDLYLKKNISMGEVSYISEKGYKKGSENYNEIEALYKLGKEKFEKCLEEGLKVTPEIIDPSINIENPARLVDIIIAQLDLSISKKFNILQEMDIKKRLELANKYLDQEIDILKIKGKISNKVKEGMDETQKEFFLREQLKAIQKELGIDEAKTEEIEKYKEELEDERFPKEVKEQVEKQLKRLEKLPDSSAEGGIIRTYIDFIIELPWKKYSDTNLDIKKAYDKLDKTHYGLDQVKDRIIEYLSVEKISNDKKSPILCFVGPPGVGKTSIGKAIAETLEREFVRISLGGVKDEAEIRGHRRTYIGALPGRILRGVQQSKKSNPVFMLDEIDKLGADFRGDPASAMLEVLDPEQNDNFEDHYLELKYDLSKVFFITTANKTDTIPEPLLDRMEVIKITGYTLNEKVKIANRYLIPKQLKKKGLEKYGIEFSKKGLEKVILNYTREAGVRNLERAIGKAFRKIAKKIALAEDYNKKIDEKEVRELFGVEKYEMTDIEDTNPIGVSTGLAWTQTGGDILNIEVAFLKGKGDLILTGNLGDVMQESAQAALTYVRGKIESYNGEEDYYKKCDVHIHVPEGAVPKDGPSAGITLASAMLSKFLNKKLPKGLAMTGEITLTGRILAIGGLKEKLLAGKLRGIKKVLVPKKNEKNVEDIPDEIKKGLEIIYISHMDEVFEKIKNQDF